MLPVQALHTAFLSQLFQDPQVMAYSEGPLDQAALAAWIAQGRAAFAAPGGGAWLVTSRANETSMGYVNLLPQDLGWGPELWLGCRLLPAYWGQGLARQACTAALDRAFNVCNVPAVAAAIDPGNTPSRRLAQNLGFVEEDIYFPAAYHHPDGVYRLKKEHWHG